MGPGFAYGLTYLGAPMTCGERMSSANYTNDTVREDIRKDLLLYLRSCVYSLLPFIRLYWTSH